MEVVWLRLLVVFSYLIVFVDFGVLSRYGVAGRAIVAGPTPVFKVDPVQNYAEKLESVKTTDADSSPYQDSKQQGKTSSIWQPQDAPPTDYGNSSQERNDFVTFSEERFSHILNRVRAIVETNLSQIISEAEKNLSVRLDKLQNRLEIFSFDELLTLQENLLKSSIDTILDATVDVAKSLCQEIQDDNCSFAMYVREAGERFVNCSVSPSDCRSYFEGISEESSKYLQTFLNKLERIRAKSLSVSEARNSTGLRELRGDLEEFREKVSLSHKTHSGSGKQDDGSLHTSVNNGSRGDSLGDGKISFAERDKIPENANPASVKSPFQNSFGLFRSMRRGSVPLKFTSKSQNSTEMLYTFGTDGVHRDKRDDESARTGNASVNAQKDTSEPDYRLTVTLPSFIGMGLFILCCCYCLRTGGWFCNLFLEERNHTRSSSEEKLV